jgi:hypothetical protein
MIRWLEDCLFGEEPQDELQEDESYLRLFEYDANELDEDDLIWEWRGIIPFY